MNKKKSKGNQVEFTLPIKVEKHRLVEFTLPIKVEKHRLKDGKFDSTLRRTLP